MILIRLDILKNLVINLTPNIYNIITAITCGELEVLIILGDGRNADWFALEQAEFQLAFLEVVVNGGRTFNIDDLHEGSVDLEEEDYFIHLSDHDCYSFCNT